MGEIPLGNRTSFEAGARDLKKSAGKAIWASEAVTFNAEPDTTGHSASGMKSCIKHCSFEVVSSARARIQLKLLS